MTGLAATANLATAIRQALGDDTPSAVTTEWVSQRFGITQARVTNAISRGQLPAEKLFPTSQRSAFLVNPVDAFTVWGWRLLEGQSLEPT